MNGVHDLGGQRGHGPILIEKHEPVFQTAWEGRVYALMGLARRRGLFNLDEMRRTIEGMAPAEYLRASYYERWLTALEKLVEEKSGWTGPEPPPPLARAEPLPRFKVGDKVRARNRHPRGHTRLPRYARGKQGVVELVHGPFLLPDLNAHGLGRRPEPVYTVRFTSQELWGDDGRAGESTSIDLWESYLVGTRFRT